VRRCGSGLLRARSGFGLASFGPGDPRRRRWHIDGQKVWTTFATVRTGSTSGRTDSDPALRHRGLSLLLVPVASPASRSGRSRHHPSKSHECFFNDARTGDHMWSAVSGTVGVS